MKPAEVLRKAAHVVADRGLAKGKFAGPCGDRCAIGAINEAAGLRPNASQDWVCEWFNYGQHLISFNDAAETTAHDVASLLIERGRGD